MTDEMPPDPFATPTGPDPIPTPPPGNGMPIPPHLFFAPIAWDINVMRMQTDGGYWTVLSIAGQEGIAVNFGWPTEQAGQIGAALVEFAAKNPNTGLITASADQMPPPPVGLDGSGR